MALRKARLLTELNVQGMRAYTKLAERPSGAWLHAEVVGVHTSKCPATKNGKKHGLCKCGAYEMFEEWLATHELKTRIN